MSAFLTDRELAVLRAIADGATRGELAQTLFVSLTNVKTITKRMYGKLGARNGPNAVHIGWQRGLLGDVADQHRRDTTWYPGGEGGN